MEPDQLTTSFGRRPETLGQIAARMRLRRAAEELARAAAQPGANTPAAVNKWALYRTLTEVRERLGVSDRSLSVLNALLSFHPEVALSLPKARVAAPGEEASADEATPSCDLIVFPSNKALSQRAHGMTERTLLRHLTELIDAGLLTRRDSPNGKRYARKGPAGQGDPDGQRFTHAFGFDLTPLVVRAGAFEAMAEALRAERRRRQLTQERISLMRRDVSKLVGLGLDEGLPGDWEILRLRAMALMTPLRRIRQDSDLARLEADLAALRADIAKLLETGVNAQEMSGNDRQPDAHQSNSKTQWPHDLEPSSREEGAEVGPQAAAASHQPAHEPTSETAPRGEDVTAAGEAAGRTAGAGGAGLPLGMVMEACPDLRDYAPGGRIRTWGDFLAAAATVRPMIGVSPDAWGAAQAALGQVEAHVAVAVILQRSIHSSEAETAPGAGDARGGSITVNGSPAIRSAGGYLRALTEEAKAGTFALGPILMATISQRLKARRGRAAGSPPSGPGAEAAARGGR